MVPLVLIPGLGSDFAVWQPTMRALGSSAECAVGDSLSDDSLPAMAERILRQAPRRFSLAGVSMGGMVALEIMRSDPGRVVRLALLDTNPHPDTPEQTSQRRSANAAVLSSDDFEALAIGSLKYLVHPAASVEVRNALVEMSVRVGAKAYARQNEAVMKRADQRQILPTIEAPTIVMVGAQDVMTPRRCRRRSGTAYAVPISTLFRTVATCLPSRNRMLSPACCVSGWDGARVSHRKKRISEPMPRTLGV